MITFKKTPIIETGTMVYLKSDATQKPYRWKIWDDAERISSGYEFCNKKEAKYRRSLEFKWQINF